MGAKELLYRRFWNPLLGQLKQGTSPERLSWSVAVGATVSVFPIFGATTSLCALAGVVFRLNHIVLQAVNYLATPLQLAAIPILIHSGESLFGLPHVSFNPLTLGSEFFANPGLFLKTYGTSGLAGVAVWAALAPFALVTIRLLFLPFLKRKTQEPTGDEPL